MNISPPCKTYAEIKPSQETGGIDDLKDWIDENSQSDVVWYLKRLSATDTLAAANGKSNSADSETAKGPFVPGDLILELVPQLNRPSEKNPEIDFDLQIDSHADARLSKSQVRCVWYNESASGGTKNDTRLSGFGGTNSPLFDPENTGALVVFAIRRSNSRPQARKKTFAWHAWICREDSEEELIEDRVGIVDPGGYRIWSFGKPVSAATNGRTSGCWLSPEQIPEAWHQDFPSGQQIIDLAIKSAPPFPHDIDKRILARRECEYLIFRSIEEAIELPMIRRGFDNIDEFVARAQTILQRRKSRSGRSLELHAKAIFLEQGLVEDTDFDFQPRVEGGKAPDYLFPNAAAYQDKRFPAKRLRMLAVKTTCKDRWRQVLNEADRIDAKHLLTLQEGVSENQFREMTEAGIVLVVPSALHRHFPESVQPSLLSLAEFLAELKSVTRNR